MTAPRQAPPGWQPWRPPPPPHGVRWGMWVNVALSAIFGVIALVCWHIYSVATSTLVGALAHPHPGGYLLAAVICAALSAVFGWVAWTVRHD